VRTASQILRENRIATKSTAIGRYYTTCPQCSLKRKTANQNLKCLGVTITTEGVKFGCNHCGWTGGWKYEVRPSHVTTIAEKSRSALPLQLWSEAVSARGTIAEKYLTSRQLALPDRHDEVLRFHPSCPFGPGARHPCMVALYRDIKTNEPKAIHRTALTANGEKIDRKALGPKAGCAIKLNSDEDITEGLTIAEGLETALAGMALNFRPAWAVGDAGEMAKFAVLSGVGSLTILVDRDPNGTGQSAALECSRRWTSAGREVFRVIPTAVGMDMADVVRGRAA
jgi:putative DNA primase/helicase